MRYVSEGSVKCPLVTMLTCSKFRHVSKPRYSRHDAPPVLIKVDPTIWSNIKRYNYVEQWGERMLLHWARATDFLDGFLKDTTAERCTQFALLCTALALIESRDSSDGIVTTVLPD
jgi:hypothetical protein